MEMIRNPTTIQEITRNHDRALINLESLPSGYNVRQRIYRDFQEPMLNVAHEQFGDNPLNTNSSLSSTANTSQLNNPQMQRVREQNHEVSQFVNNQDLMCQTMEMIRIPTTIQEITRNHDRDLINLESLPSGYNVRQRIYRDFQEPMLNVAHEQFGDNPGGISEYYISK
ncbi:hypothetical protein GJ496_003374 [Pomphorhynchus laevis]|nr:hypothetical protein GJ496_003374 [Pomphorhynchus laevis]